MGWLAILGVYGAIVASMTVAWNVWIARRDRGQLTLRLQMHRFAQDPVSGELRETAVDRLDGCQLEIQVVNKGRRPITVVAWYLVPPTRGAAHVLLQELSPPHTLNETSPMSMWCDAQTLVDGVRKMYVVDTTGRRSYVCRRHLSSITQRIAALHVKTPA